MVKQLAVNEHRNLMLQEQKFLSASGVKSKMFRGILWRTYTELDLFEMERINECIRKKEQIEDVDIDFMLGIYEGHTIFSIYFD